MAILITPDGKEKNLRIQSFNLDNPKDKTFEAIKKALGFRIGQVVTKDGRILIIDVDGQASGKPVNRKASILANGNLIYGNAVLVTRDQANPPVYETH